MTEREKLIVVMAEDLKRLPYADVIVPDDVWAVDYATAALTALEAAGVRLVPESVTPQMAVCLESNFAVCEPASELHAANWRSAYRAMLAASPYAPEGTRND